MASQAEAPHIADVVPMEDVTLSLVDHPANPLVNVTSSFVDPLVIPSLATNESIGTTADHSTTSLINGASLSLVDASAIPSLVTDVSMAIDHSAAPLINVAHINDDPNAQLPGTLSTAVTISTASEPVSEHNISAVSSLMFPERPEPLSNPLVVELNNPVVATTQMLTDISAVSPNVPTNAVIMGPTGTTKKAGIMRPNSHSKTAR
jgi:hypothetical protein